MASSLQTVSHYQGYSEWSFHITETNINDYVLNKLLKFIKSIKKIKNNIRYIHPYFILMFPIESLSSHHFRVSQRLSEFRQRRCRAFSPFSTSSSEPVSPSGRHVAGVGGRPSTTSGGVWSREKHWRRTKKANLVGKLMNHDEP